MSLRPASERPGNPASEAQWSLRNILGASPAEVDPRSGKNGPVAVSRKMFNLQLPRQLAKSPSGSGVGDPVVPDVTNCPPVLLRQAPEPPRIRAHRPTSVARIGNSQFDMSSRACDGRGCRHETKLAAALERESAVATKAADLEERLQRAESNVAAKDAQHGTVVQRIINEQSLIQTRLEDNLAALQLRLDRLDPTVVDDMQQQICALQTAASSDMAVALEERGRLNSRVSLLTESLRGAVDALVSTGAGTAEQIAGARLSLADPGVLAREPRMLGTGTAQAGSATPISGGCTGSIGVVAGSNIVRLSAAKRQCVRCSSKDSELNQQLSDIASNYQMLRKQGRLSCDTGTPALDLNVPIDETEIGARAGTAPPMVQAVVNDFKKVLIEANGGKLDDN